ncbi:acyl-CoA carboxylase epsilon subunit [Streptomyces antimicrobicus]|uniref:Acyl-CoA carboxylase subunit epsilon n=1 Tax=Streptomyces antimicrobicus TaxID=2883108 RepID=A0ABS8BEY4_9ACTN|nr:acyl-CoA carboxylase epsilon subunit [Streptomyces antimicrobicus]MCB5183193.1 hypothetical protein [Streptomyces antimicrobicus]
MSGDGTTRDAAAWRIVRGIPDADETAALAVVLAACLARAAAPAPPGAEHPSRRTGWDRGLPFRPAGTWRASRGPAGG